MSNNVSKKHHYLPVHYLNGFTDSNNTFYVYDKKTGKIFPTSPNGVFFENDLNTVTFPNGESLDFLEDLYTEIENQSWGTFNKIRESTHKTPIELLDKLIKIWKIYIEYGKTDTIIPDMFKMLH